MTATAPSLILRAEDASRYVGLSVSTLAKMRMRGEGPTFVKLGSRAVGYRASDLNSWLKECERQSTAE